MDDIVTQNLLATAQLDCGPGNRRDTVKVTTFAQAGFAIVDVFEVQTVAFTGSCAGPLPLPLPASLECPESSKKAPAANATLTFK